jgi:hypothetical protein
MDNGSSEKGKEQSNRKRIHGRLTDDDFRGGGFALTTRVTESFDSPS